MREYYAVEGGQPLNGSVRIHGAKNAVLPILAACVLNGAENELLDCPNLSDVDATVAILKELGCRVQRNGSVLWVDSKEVKNAAVPEHLMKEMRSSVIFLGALAARMREAHICLPGGCELGPRPIDMHIEVMRALGMEVVFSENCLHCYAHRTHAADIALRFPSVGATENAMLAATAVSGTTRIFRAAKEPEIVDLAAFLNGQGACIKGAGTDVVVIEGKKPMHSVRYRIMPDRILTATLMGAVQMAGGIVYLENARLAHLQAVAEIMRACGLNIREEEGGVVVRASRRTRAIPYIKTEPYPGFPTDAQAILTAVLTTAAGTSRIEETIFSARFHHVPELNKMGAQIKTKAQQMVIDGVEALHGADVYAGDLRAGAALLIAALGAKGTTRVHRIEHIKRGYEDPAKSWRALGAHIEEKTG